MYLVLFIVFVAVLLVVYLALKSAQQQNLIKPTDLSFLPSQFVVVDVETTGLDPHKHQIIEIGAIKVNRDSNNHVTFQALVKCNGKLPRKISEMTGITADMLEKDGGPLDTAIAEFLEFAGDLRLVAFNAPFDLAFLSKAASQIEKRIENPISDALDMARRAWPGRKSYRLVHLARDGGLSTDGMHRSLNDCRLTVTVYCAAAAKLRALE
jgi:DNA polymerase III epsilon subunit family exonuclease